MSAVEANFDGLVGPTHNYAGLSFGNLASSANRDQPSNPRAAALQGLEKMKTLADLGLVQGVLAPQERPDISTLRRLGFYGTDSEVLLQASQQAPRLLANCCSASSMWTANAATVSPSADTQDGRVHLTPANLVNKLHRSIEPDTTSRILQATFVNPTHFAHHTPLPPSELLGDEGAANHNRLCQRYGAPGIELFVYGRSAFDADKPAPTRYPARQTLEACEAIARKHQLSASHLMLVQQNPAVIDQGVFHNDVIAVANRSLLFCHAQAFVAQAQVYDQLNQRLDGTLRVIEVDDEEVSISDAVASYLFNSQLLSLPNDDTLLVVPTECRDNERVWRCLQRIEAEQLGIDRIEVLDLRQSMANGGGPACLRLRVVLTEQELAGVNPRTLLTPTLYQRLKQWIESHYRDRLRERDLADPHLLQESRQALDELTQILQLGAIYPFQR